MHRDQVVFFSALKLDLIQEQFLVFGQIVHLLLLTRPRTAVRNNKNVNLRLRVAYL